MVTKINRAVKTKDAPASAQYSKALAHDIAETVANCADGAGAMLTLRERLLALVAGIKGQKGKPLPEPFEKMVRDEVESIFKARPTIKADSVGPMTTTATKIAKWAPCLSALEPAEFSQVASAYGKLGTFCTLVKNKDGDVRAAFKEHEAKASKAPDYARSCATHFRSILGMTGKGAPNAKFKAKLVAVIDTWKECKVGERADEYRDAKLAAS